MELAKVDGAWLLSGLRGVANAPVSPETEAAIHARLHLAGVGRLADGAHLPTSPADELRCERVRQIGTRSFTAGERGEMASALRSIHGRSRADGDAAYCIAGLSRGFVQFLDRRGEALYLVEVCSHHYEETIGPRLTEQGVTLLVDECGFRWPLEKGNFARDVSVPDEHACGEIADFALGILHEFFGHRSGRKISFEVYVPCAGALVEFLRRH